MAQTPDSLRLSRLDRLIGQLGDHQLSIRAQGSSVTDLVSRVAGLERRVADDMQALWPLREVDVQGELTAARASIDKLAKQVALLGRDLEEGRIQAEKRVQQLEARQAEAERQLVGMAAAVEAAAGEAAAAVEELRLGTRGMLSEVISRIADQFDALQAALDEAIGGRAADAEERAATARLVQQSLEAQRQWLEERAEGLQHRVEARLEAADAAAAAVAEQQQQRVHEQLQAVQAAVQQEAAGLRERTEAAEKQLGEQQRVQEGQGAQLEQQGEQLAALEQGGQQLAAAQSSAGVQQEAAHAALRQQLEALAEEQAAAGARQDSAEGLLRQALTVWQRGLEEQVAAAEVRLAGQVAAATTAQHQLAEKFEEYKGYVKRLRREVAEARAEQEANSVQIAAARHEFGGAHDKMGRAQAEAAALGGELLEAAAAAAAAGSAVRHIAAVQPHMPPPEGGRLVEL